MKVHHKTILLNWGITISVVFGVVSIIIGIAFWLHGAGSLAAKQDLTDLGNFGSYLQGTTASLWALAGVTFIMVAFLAQTRQFQIQQDSINRQNFESSFFQLLNMQNDIAKEITVIISGTAYNGRSAFKLLYSELGSHMSFMEHGKHLLANQSKAYSLSMERDFVIEQYWKFYPNYQAELGHYFRSLYHVIKFVKSSDFDHATQRRYTSLVRAQLSAFELALLFYNGLSRLGSDKFKPLIEEFGLLKNLEKSILLDTAYQQQQQQQQHQVLYEQSAYH